MQYFARNAWESVCEIQLKMPSSLGGRIAIGAAASVAAAALLWKFHFRHRFLANYLSKKMIPLSDKRLGPRKKKLFVGMQQLKKQTGGRNLVIIDVGSGNGVNFQYYPEGSAVICVDPNPHMEAFLRAGSADWPAGVHVSQYHATYCEQMHDVIEPEVADAVVMGGLMCGVPDIGRCLEEVYRVLKPGGKIFFTDHVLSPPEYPFIRLIQRTMNPLISFIIGCNVNRNPEPFIRRAGFKDIDAEHFEAFELEQPTRVSPVIPLIRSRYYGSGTK